MPRPAVVTLGVFDGFHLGHRLVVTRARRRADAGGMELVVFTFHPHPKAVLRPDGAPPALTGLDEKVALLREAGADTVRVLRFTRELSALGPEAFLGRHLFPFHRVASLVVGHDFALGRDRTGSAERLAALGRRWGFLVERVPALETEDGSVASTRIRAALAAGDVAAAARDLGRPYRVQGPVVPGAGRGKRLGFPTANLQVPADRLLPGHGVYAVRILGLGEEPRPGVVNIGRRPTFDGNAVTVEAHVLDFSGDLAGRRLILEFAARLREERRFETAGALADQIAADVIRAREALQTR